MAQLDPQVVNAVITGSVAILSSVATLVTTHFLRHTGKLILNVNQVSIVTSKSDGAGGMEITKVIGKVNSADCIFEIDIYNSSESPMSLRATYIEMVPRINNETYRLAIVLPHQGGNINYSANLPNTMNIINFPPKEMLHLQIHSYFLPEEKIAVEGRVDFYFRGKHPNGKIFRKKLCEEDFNLQ